MRETFAAVVRRAAMATESDSVVTANSVARRTVLTGLTAAGGLALTPRVAAASGPQSLPAAPPPSAADIVDVRTFGAKGDGVTDDTAAVEAAFTAARDRATEQTVVGGVPYKSGLPPVYFPQGVYRITRTLRRANERGLLIYGDSMHSTILKLSAGVDLFRVERGNRISWRDMTLACGSNPTVDGLLENSCAVHWHEDGDYTPGVGANTVFLFDNVEFLGFHRAMWWTGDEMGDNITWTHCVWRDNFLDFAYLNGQSLNHRVVGGEILGFRQQPIVAYNKRLASWSQASRMPTGRLNQPQIPGVLTSPRQNVTVHDGAVVKTTLGGNLAFWNTSLIVKKTTVLCGRVPPAPLDTYGDTDNRASFAFDYCRWELHWTDAAFASGGRDAYGYQRSTLLRFENPHPAPGDGRMHPVITFNQCQAIFATTLGSLDLVHLSNAVTVFWRNGCQVLRGSAVTLVSCITAGSTAGLRGRFAGQDSHVFARRRDTRNVGGTAYAAVLNVDHTITQSPMR